MGWTWTEKILSVGAITGTLYIVKRVASVIFPELPTLSELIFGKEMIAPPQVENVSKTQLG